MDERLWWYLSRATGLVAWGLAVTSILLGLALASRALGKKPPAPWLLALHRWTGGLTVVFTLGHVGALVADSFVHFGWADLLVPFASSWESAAVGWGVIAMWLLVAIQLTSLQMRRLPKRLWRAVHVSSYVVAILATAHGFAAGTDTRSGAFAWVAVAAIGSMTFLAAYRALAPIKGARARRASARPGRSAEPTQVPDRPEDADRSAVATDVDDRRSTLAAARARVAASRASAGTSVATPAEAPARPAPVDRAAQLAAARARLAERA
ncbi:MAG: ferric reductase-like transmembrane domain-containing protein [Acidimicrobiia bacterium]|jgi:methionine sulfoxide reductase heme-binding subunit